MKLLKIWKFCVLFLVLVNVKNTNARGISTPERWSNRGEKESLLSSFDDFETTQVGGRNLPNDELISQAVAAGMDRNAVTELLRTKQPIITTDTDANGVRRTTTYKLTADGFISKRTETERSTPLSLGTRGSFDRSRTSAASTDLATAASNPDNDWELAPKQKTNTRTYTFSSSLDNPFDDDFFKPRGTTTGTSNVQINWPATNWINRPEANLPPCDNPKTTFKTEVDDKGRTITTKLTTCGNVPLDRWPSPVGSQFPNLFVDEQRRTRLPSIPDKPSSTLPEADNSLRTTTTQRPQLLTFDEWKALHYGSSTTTPRPLPSFEDNQPGVNLKPRVDVVLRPEPPSAPTPRTTTQFPSLEDFLQTQYGQSTPVYTFDLDKINPTTSTVKINIDDLPATPVPALGTPKPPNEIKPLIDDVWLRGLTNPDVETVHPNTATTSESGRKVSTLSQTLNSARPPTIADLDPKIQAILIRGGFTDEDLQNSNGNSVSKTVVDGDGRTKTTTFHIRRVPNTLDTPSVDTRRPLPRQDEHTRQERALHPNEVEPSRIDSYLAKVNLTPEEITARKGVLTHTIIEDDGRILTATFVLSTVKGSNEHVEVPTPLK